jgi:hypothetical protein
MNFYAMENNGGQAWSAILGQGNFHRATRFGKVTWWEKDYTPPAPSAAPAASGAAPAASGAAPAPSASAASAAPPTAKPRHPGAGTPPQLETAEALKAKKAAGNP